MTPSRARPLHLQWPAVLLVLGGGAVGTLGRYALASGWPTRSGDWPWGTFAANLAGCLILGALLEALSRGGTDAGWRRNVRLLAGTGCCGGLTTYSTFAVEADLLVRAAHPGTAFAYVVVSLGAGFVATFVGIVMSSRRADRTPAAP